MLFPIFGTILGNFNSRNYIITENYSIENQATLNYTWIENWSRYNDEDDIPYAITFDSQGNIIMVGRSLNQTSYSDNMIVAYNSTGTQLWNHTYDGGHIDEFRGVVTYGNDIYAAGTFYNQSNSRYEIDIVKYSNQVPVWRKIWFKTGATSTCCLNMDIDSSGNLYLVGYVSMPTGMDGLILKLDSSGDEIWNVTYNDTSSNTDTCYSILINGTDMFIGGSTESWGIGGTYADGFVAKYDQSTGAFIWNFTWNSTSNQESTRDIAMDLDGNLYLVGNTVDGVGFYSRGVILKYNTSRDLQWVKQYNDFGHGRAFGIVVDTVKNFTYMIGQAIDDAFMPTIEDLVIIKYDFDGEIIKNWTWNGPNNGSDQGNAGIVDGSGNLYVIGETQGSVDKSDAILMKIEIYQIQQEQPEGPSIPNSPQIPGFEFFFIFISLLSILGLYHFSRARKIRRMSKIY